MNANRFDQALSLAGVVLDTRTSLGIGRITSGKNVWIFYVDEFIQAKDQLSGLSPLLDESERALAELLMAIGGPVISIGTADRGNRGARRELARKADACGLLPQALRPVLR